MALLNFNNIDKEWIKNYNASIADFEGVYRPTYQPPSKPQSTEIVAEVTIDDTMNHPHHHPHEREALLKEVRRQLAGKLIDTILEQNLLEIEEFNKATDDYFQDKKVIRARLRVGSERNWPRTPPITASEVINKDGITQEQKDFIWKLLPPKITGIDPSKNSLRHLQVGLEQTDEYKKLGNKIAKALNQK